jgi:hypothetical protein
MPAAGRRKARRGHTGAEGALPSPPNPSAASSSSSTHGLSDGPAGAPTNVRRRASPSANANSLLQSSLEWSSALDTLAADTCEYDIRPAYLSGKSKRQVFVERPPRRRAAGGDKWRNSGGAKGGTDHWHDESHGLRKRYGRVYREETGRTSLKFMQFTLLHKIAGKEVEDKTVCLYAVEGTQDEPEPAVPLETRSGPVRAVDLASDGFADVALGMPRKLPPGGGAASRSVASKHRRGTAARRHTRATIDVDAGLSANPRLFATRASLPFQMMMTAESPGASQNSQADSDSIETIDWLPGSYAESGGDGSASDAASAGTPSTKGSLDFHAIDDAVRVFDAFDEWDSSSDRSSTPPQSGSDADEMHVVGGYWNGSIDRSYTAGSEVTDMVDLGADWTSGSDILHPPPLSSGEVEDMLSLEGYWNSGSDSSCTPPLSGSDLDGITLENGERGAENNAQRDDPVAAHAHSVNELKRKAPQLQPLPNAAKKGRMASTAACAAGLGLCMIVIGTLLRSGPDDSGPGGEIDSTDTCAQGPVSITGVVDNMLCSAAPEGSSCPYECALGFMHGGRHTCTRNPSGQLTYSGGACVLDSPCDEGVDLLDDGILNLAADGASRLCTWELACNNESLSPVLTFSSFKVGYGNLSLYDGSSYPYANEQLLGNDAPSHSHRLGQQRRSTLSPEAQTILHGIDPWWISQPISVAQSTAHLEYNSDLSGPDLFTASFTCGLHTEQCTLTDELELDWMTLQHPERAKVELPAWFSMPPSVAESISEWYPPPHGVTDCSSKPCANGVCIDSASSHGAYSSETAFAFVCDCQPGWSGELCDVRRPGKVQPCTAEENDCNSTVSVCESVLPGQHECMCFSGYTASAQGTCELAVEDPPVGRAWQSGPGYEASDHIVRGTFSARIGESPHLLQTTILSTSAFFDPASYKQVLIEAPSEPDGCTLYNGTVDVSGKVAVVSDDKLCEIWVKVVVAQIVGATAVIMYGDDIPSISKISWDVGDPGEIDPTWAGAGKTAEELGLEITIPVIITSRAQGQILRRASLSGPTWVDLHCSRTQHLLGGQGTFL